MFLSINFGAIIFLVIAGVLCLGIGKLLMMGHQEWLKKNRPIGPEMSLKEIAKTLGQDVIRFNSPTSYSADSLKDHWNHFNKSAVDKYEKYTLNDNLVRNCSVLYGPFIKEFLEKFKNVNIEFYSLVKKDYKNVQRVKLTAGDEFVIIEINVGPKKSKIKTSNYVFKSFYKDKGVLKDVEKDGIVEDYVIDRVSYIGPKSSLENDYLKEKKITNLLNSHNFTAKPKNTKVKKTGNYYKPQKASTQYTIENLSVDRLQTSIESIDNLVIKLQIGYDPETKQFAKVVHVLAEEFVSKYYPKIIAGKGNLLLTGVTGSGKSSLLDNLMYNYANTVPILSVSGFELMQMFGTSQHSYVFNKMSTVFKEGRKGMITDTLEGEVIDDTKKEKKSPNSRILLSIDEGDDLLFNEDQHSMVKSLLGGELKKSYNLFSIICINKPFSELSDEVTRHGRTDIVAEVIAIPANYARDKADKFDKDNKNFHINKERLEAILAEKTRYSEEETIATSEFFSTAESNGDNAVDFYSALDELTDLSEMITSAEADSSKNHVNQTKRKASSKRLK